MSKDYTYPRETTSSARAFTYDGIYGETHLTATVLVVHQVWPCPEEMPYDSPCKELVYFVKQHQRKAGRWLVSLPVAPSFGLEPVFPSSTILETGPAYAAAAAYLGESFP